MPRFMIPTSVLLIMVLTGCTPGIYTRLDSSAPVFGPVCPGMTRQDAERYLGPPLLTQRLDRYHYRNIYHYYRERSVTDILVTDIMDFTTFGLGTLLVSPIDRFADTTHLMAITYQGADQDIFNDRVVAIVDRVSGQLSHCESW